jgi:hypothetical protein
MRPIKAHGTFSLSKIRCICIVFPGRDDIGTLYRGLQSQDTGFTDQCYRALLH